MPSIGTYERKIETKKRETERDISDRFYDLRLSVSDVPRMMMFALPICCSGVQIINNVIYKYILKNYQIDRLTIKLNRETSEYKSIAQVCLASV